ncbi:MAG: hypothetical protein ACKVT1_19065 [Dehalococcoidia bacterium]
MTDALAAYAEAEATKDEADMVMASHVRRAESWLVNERRRSRIREVAVVVGGALVGAFVQGMVTELTADAVDAVPVGVYVTMGFVGMTGVFLAIR